MLNNFVIDIVAYPLGWIMWFLYSIVPNYGVVIILFAIITKLLLYPVSLHQHKSVIGRTRLQPKMNELKNKHSKNPQKYNEEMMALYKTEGVSPTAGCLPVLIQMPILFGLLSVIYNPLKHIVRIPNEIITKVIEITNTLIGSHGRGMGDIQLRAISAVKTNPEAFISLGQDIIHKIQEVNFNFLGIDLSVIPGIPKSFSDISMVLIIPVISGLSMLFSSMQSMKNSNATAVDEASKQAAQSMKMMMFIGPAFSFYFAFKVAAGVGLYWAVTNILNIIQTSILYKRHNPVEIIKKAQEELQIQKELERAERAEAKKNAHLLVGDDIYKSMSTKEANKSKLASARKRDAEKYGDYDDNNVREKEE